MKYSYIDDNPRRNLDGSYEVNYGEITKRGTELEYQKYFDDFQDAYAFIEKVRREIYPDVKTIENFFYFIDLNERGYFQAHVENSKHKVVWSIDLPEYDSETNEILPTLVDDGFIKSFDDEVGLWKYFVSMKILPENSTLISMQ